MSYTRHEYRGFFWWLEPSMCCPVLKISHLSNGDNSQYLFRTPSNDKHEQKVWAWVDARLQEDDAA